ncbi:Uncharacterised protein [Kluyvera cryocrescens]|uniref:Uncharacterized protein n=1 Tax=Kluyvera cryocrescens TaxID=580 RepID=A0A485AJI8_KLUCR|nr:Uncharacterised protein [Kluyvera cryocrescens]
MRWRCCAGEFYFGPHVSWLFADEAELVHLHTDERAECPELEILLNVLVARKYYRASWRRGRLCAASGTRCWYCCCVRYWG